MMNRTELIVDGNTFSIKYFDDLIPVEYFRSFQYLESENYDGLIEVFFVPKIALSEKECETIFADAKNELMFKIKDIIAQYPKLYSNFEIGENFYHTLYNYIDAFGHRIIGQCSKRLKIRKKNNEEGLN